LRANQDSLPEYGERQRKGEPISTGRVESATNEIIAKRVAKAQQMVRRDKTGMELRMKEPYEKGVAIHSAPSFALGAVKHSVKRKQGEGRAGY
jgi:hypothetical protein